MPDTHGRTKWWFFISKTTFCFCLEKVNKIILKYKIFRASSNYSNLCRQYCDEIIIRYFGKLDHFYEGKNVFPLKQNDLSLSKYHFSIVTSVDEATLTLKSKTGVNFINIFCTLFSLIFWRQKTPNPKHSFVIFGAKILAKNVRVKCWWNWHQEFIEQSFCKWSENFVGCICREKSPLMMSK